MQIVRRADESNTGLLILGLAGDLDIAALPSVQSAVDQAINTGTRQLIVDLSQVDSIDSNGLGLLGAIESQCESSQVRLAVASSCPELRRHVANSGAGLQQDIHISIDRARQELMTIEGQR